MSYHFEELGNIRVDPFIGRGYYNTIEGKRLVCVGNSYYAGMAEREECSFSDYIGTFAHPGHELHFDDCWEFISSFLSRDYDGEEPHISKKRIKKAFMDSLEHGYWDRMGFYPYLQSGYRMFTDFQSDLDERLAIDREAAFMEMLERLSPDIVLTADLDLFRDLPESRQPGQDFHLSDGEEVLTCEFILNNGHFVKLHYVPVKAFLSPAETIHEIIRCDSLSTPNRKQSIIDIVGRQEFFKVVRAFEKEGYIEMAGDKYQWNESKAEFAFWMMEACHYLGIDRNQAFCKAAGTPFVPQGLFLEEVSLGNDPDWSASRNTFLQLRGAIFSKNWDWTDKNMNGPMNRKEKDRLRAEHAKMFVDNYSRYRHRPDLRHNYRKIVDIFDKI